jgi:hypothetical protein
VSSNIESQLTYPKVPLWFSATDGPLAVLKSDNKKLAAVQNECLDLLFRDWSA